MLVAPMRERRVEYFIMRNAFSDLGKMTKRRRMKEVCNLRTIIEEFSCSTYLCTLLLLQAQVERHALDYLEACCDGAAIKARGNQQPAPLRGTAHPGTPIGIKARRISGAHIALELGVPGMQARSCASMKRAHLPRVAVAVLPFVLCPRC
jgi:hypothetical protein